MLHEIFQHERIRRNADVIIEHSSPLVFLLFFEHLLEALHQVNIKDVQRCSGIKIVGVLHAHDRNQAKRYGYQSSLNDATLTERGTIDPC